MKQLDLSHTALLDHIIQFTIEGDYIDLHNCFICTKIETDPFNSVIVFHFESETAYYLLCFYNATPYQIQYEGFGKTDEKGLSFDSFSRIIAVENKEGKWVDLPTDKSYYAINFTEGFEMVVEAGKVLLLEADFNRLQDKRAREKQLAFLSMELENLRKELANLEKHAPKETKLYLQKRKQQRDTMASLEKEQAHKQDELAAIVLLEQQVIMQAGEKYLQH